MTMQVPPDFKALATKYVDDQLAVMKKYGSEPILSPAEYYSLIEECEQVGRKLWRSTTYRSKSWAEGKGGADSAEPTKEKSNE